MTPGASIQATIELVESIFSSWKEQKRFPADKMLEQFFKSRRYIGSKDRALVGELFYWVLRHKAALEWYVEKYAPSTPYRERAMVIAGLILRKDYNYDSIQSITKDSQYSPLSFSTEEQEMIKKLMRHSMEHDEMPDFVRFNFPEWLQPLLQESLGDDWQTALRGLNTQATTDLRVNTLKTTREELQKNLQEENFDTELTQMSPTGLRLNKRSPIFTSAYFKQGHFEVQDEGSQLVALCADAQPGQRVIDFCAGAGGKTLAMAASMQNKGRILAWDTSQKRLDQIKPRLRRAGVDNVQVQSIESETDAYIKRHKLSADRVLIDVPCSGSGTWRRNPDLKWRFTQKDLDEVLLVQQSILESAARLVKKGGYLIYATCSILRSENNAQITKFLESNPHFRVVCVKKIWDKNSAMQKSDKEINDMTFLSLMPHRDGVDGFFAAVLERLQD